jgi:hypothetical protein
MGYKKLSVGTIGFCATAILFLFNSNHCYAQARAPKAAIQKAASLPKPAQHTASKNKPAIQKPSMEPAKIAKPADRQRPTIAQAKIAKPEAPRALPALQKPQAPPASQPMAPPQLATPPFQPNGKSSSVK